MYVCTILVGKKHEKNRRVHNASDTLKDRREKERGGGSEGEWQSEKQANRQPKKVDYLGVCMFA